LEVQLVLREGGSAAYLIEDVGASAITSRGKLSGTPGPSRTSTSARTPRRITIDIYKPRRPGIVIGKFGQ